MQEWCEPSDRVGWPGFSYPKTTGYKTLEAGNNPSFLSTQPHLPHKPRTHPAHSRTLSPYSSHTQPHPPSALHWCLSLARVRSLWVAAAARDPQLMRPTRTAAPSCPRGGVSLSARWRRASHDTSCGGACASGSGGRDVAGASLARGAGDGGSHVA
jgi:hypothetical protein